MNDKSNYPKVAYLLSAAEIGGTEKMFLLLGQALQAKNFRLKFFLLLGKGSFSLALQEAGLDSFVVDLRKGITHWLRLIRALSRMRP
ncbi:MAG: hypothetical protein NC911_09700, partial [Candidatus Omnitrophica bacterium]|nr:hypothetical protein [Candidatus Omnitrophota bacterium]